MNFPLRLKSWLWPPLLVGFLLLCYWPALSGGLVWDDPAHVTAPELRSSAGLGRIWFELGATQQYYPVLHSAFWFEHRLWGDSAFGYHLVNVLLHAAACCLLVVVLRRLERLPAGSAPPLPAGTAWLAAFSFAVHPVCVESVAWISEQKNTLSLVLYLLAGIAYLDFHATRRKHSYVLATLLFLLALGTKTVTGTLPAALLVVLWWRTGRISWRRDGFSLLPWFLLAAVAGLLTAWVERRLIGAEGTGFDLPLAHRTLLAGRVICFYLGKLAWPVDLMFIYPRWDVRALAAGWWIYLAGVGVITGALWSVRRRWRGPLAGWLFFAGSLFPALGFFNVYPFIFSYVADHFQYLASLGVITVLAAGVARGFAGWSARARSAGWLAIALIMVGLVSLSNRQARIYADAATLYRATLATNPACWMAHNNLGLLLAQTPAGATEARGHFEEAVRLRADYAEAHNNLGVELTKLPGRQIDALTHFETALRIQPGYAEAHCNLANILATQDGRMPEAMAHYAEALRLKPDLPEIHFRFANALVNLPGRRDEAVAQYQEALRLNPGYVEALMNLAIVMAKLPGRQAEALDYYVRALAISPQLPELHYNLAVLLAASPERLDEAIAEFQEALRLQPNYAQAHNNLGTLLARRGRLAEARRHWEQALALVPDYEDARRNLRLLEEMQAGRTGK